MANDVFYFDSHRDDESLNARVYSGGTDLPNLLFKGFMLSDTLQVQITNSWGKQNDFVTRIQEKGAEVANSIVNNIRAADRLSGNWISRKTGTNDTLNAKYISASNFYKSFQGTDITYPGLEVVWYLICDTSDFDIVGTFNKQIPKFVGRFTTENNTGGLTGKITAPNGFTMPQSFGKEIPGSFIIVTKASTYRNLLCTEVTYEISSQRTQNDKPLYIVSTFKFIPGSLVTLNQITTNHIK